MEKVFGDQSPHRADIHDVAGKGRPLETFIEEGVDDGPVPTLDHTEPLVLGDLPHESDAACAHHAPVGVEEHIAAEVVPTQDPLRLPSPPGSLFLNTREYALAVMSSSVSDNRNRWRKQIAHTDPAPDRGNPTVTR